MKRLALGYAMTAGTAALVDIGGFDLLARGLPGVLVPAVLSFCAAAVVNYLLSSRWVWRQDWRCLSRAARFALFASIGLGINSGMTWLLASLLPIAPTLAKAGGVGFAFTANFLMNARWVFTAATPGQPQSSL